MRSFFPPLHILIRYVLKIRYTFKSTYTILTTKARGNGPRHQYMWEGGARGGMLK